MTLLVISRKYPPSTGGTQEYAYQLIRHLAQTDTVYRLAYPVPRLLLPIFFIYALAQGWMMRRAVQSIHVCDGALAPLGLILKLLTRKPITIAINGTDIVYNNRLYQWMIPFCLRRLDKVICNSHTTKAECLKRGISEQRLCFIPYGIPNELYRKVDRRMLRQQLVTLYSVSPDKKVLLSIGRLIELKGFQWFIAEVMPRILERRQDIVYLLGGAGPMEQTLRRLIREQNLSGSVRLLGRITDRSVLALLYNAADLFVMPNVPVQGRIEGFGLVALEAASCGLPVVASRLDGLQDAIVDGQNGFLVEPLSPTQFASTILSLLDAHERLAAHVRSTTLQEHTWERIAERYRQQFQDLVESAD